MKIYIVGCAKSGTTLLKRMFYSFQVGVVVEECNINDFSRAQGNLVAKRTHNTLFCTSILRQHDIDSQLSLMKDMFVINVVRHPYSVLKSYKKDWGLDGGADWVNSMIQFNKYKDYIDLTIRYEDLVEFPDYIQEVIIEKTKLKPVNDFSAYPAFFPSNQVEIGAIDNYALRPLDKDKLVIPKRPYTIVKDEVINKYMKQFNYDK